jgi:hypothetical protein
VSSSTVDFKTFVDIQKYLVTNHNIIAVWNILRAFDYTTGLVVDDRVLM